LEHGIEVYPWEYTHQAGAKPINHYLAVRWVIAYRSDYTFSGLRTAATAGTGGLRAASVRQFLVNAIAMQIVLARNPAAVQLLQDLRYELSAETVPGLGKIPFATVSSGIASFRPPDELILSATRFSGVSAFIELVDLEAVRQMRDPLQQQLESILT